jgi:hypothetical protein
MNMKAKLIRMIRQMEIHKNPVDLDPVAFWSFLKIQTDPISKGIGSLLRNFSWSILIQAHQPSGSFLF